MNADIYQKKAWKLALPQCKSMFYMTLGIANEAGEVAGVFKKHLRGDVNLHAKDDLAKELGDTLWYIAGLASMLQLSLSDIMRQNILKCEDRARRKVQQGNGDHR